MPSWRDARSRAVLRVLKCALIAAALHWGWETAHAVAYVETDLPFAERLWHCLPMAVVDAAWSGGLVLLGLAVARVVRRRGAAWACIVAGGAISALAVEAFALRTGRWTYNDLMPILPIAGVGIWPVLQMSLLPPLALYLTARREAILRA